MKLKHHLFALLACLLWSSAFAGVKIALMEMTPFYLAGFRFTVAGLVLLPWLIKNYSRELWKIAIPVGLLQTFIQYSTFTLGLNMVDGATGAILVGMGPLAASLMTHLFFHNEKINLSKGLVLTFGILGVILISIPKGFNPEYGITYLTGIGLLIITVITSAAGSVFIAANKKKSFHPMAMNSFQFLFGGVLLILLALGTEDISPNTLTAQFYFAFSWLVFLSTGAFSIWFHLLKTPGIQVSRLSMWKFLIPVFGSLLSWLLLPDSSPDLLSILGVLISGSAVLIFFSLKKKPIET